MRETRIADAAGEQQTLEEAFTFAHSAALEPVYRSHFRVIPTEAWNDDQLEIILNTGFIIDSRFYNIEFQTEDVFGDRILLMDINGDGIPEIIGEFVDYNLRIFDVYAEREIW